MIQEISWLGLIILLNYHLGSKMVHFPQEWFIGKLKNLKKFINKTKVQKYTLMNYFGETLIGIGVCIMEIKFFLNMVYIKESIMHGKMIFLL